MVKFELMPFTPAHPAIVLPFLRGKYLSATGLIVGSITPDFEYFFKARVSGVHGHTLWGILYFDLPVALFLSFVFHIVVKHSLISNLPSFFQRRLHQLNDINFIDYFKSHYIIFIVSCFMGSCSHIFWDSFTHKGRFFVEQLSFYKDNYIFYDGAKYPLWYALQHISTVIGLVIISIYFLLMPVNKSMVVNAPKISYWIVIIVLSVFLFTTRFTLFTINYNLGNAVVTSISSILLAACLISPLQYFRSATIQKS